MDFSVKIEGLDRIDRAMKGVPEAINKEVNIALFASAKHVEAEAKKSITNGQKTGRVYKRRTVFHQASAPGEAPASDTGALVERGIASYLNKEGMYSFVVAGRGIVKYAAMLEFGTRKMAARPFLFPALERSKDWIRERLAAAVRRAAAKSVK